MDSEWVGIEITKYTDALNLYKVFVKYKKEFNKLPDVVDICFCDRYNGYVSKTIGIEQISKKNYLYKTDRIIDKMGYRQTNYGWFCEILQHAYQDFLQYEKGVLN